MLLAAAQRLRPYDAPLSGKIRTRDQPAQRFLAGAAGSRYQRCLCAVIDSCDLSVQDWSAARTTAYCTDLTELDTAHVVDLFVRQYLWVHEGWAPVGDLELLARGQVQGRDPPHSRRAAVRCAGDKTPFAAVHAPVMVVCK